MVDISNGTDQDLLPESRFQYRTVRVEHLQDMQNYIDELRKNGFFSENKVFRSYVDKLAFRLPENFPEAKYIIVIAVHSPLARANLRYHGETHSVFIPPNYYEFDFTIKQLQSTIARRIVKREDCRIEDVRHNIYLKHLAVRSGLAKYGRNNICYVDGMGSMLSLFAFFTDHVFEEDHWTDIQMMDSCEKCRICMNECPTGAIPNERFVINVEKCLSLYNEVAGEIPNWIPEWAHTSLMGCMHCQFACPANREIIAAAVDFDEVTEDETVALLNEHFNEDMTRVLSEKLKVVKPEQAETYLPVFARNLRACFSSLFKKNMEMSI
ncbi:MAG: 4Fe-4S binding protein [Candidatus Thorarchaeota archaeon]|nr:4Fe-4S binding protein [Candidatus Thorarchaeota archaeon]